MDTKAAGVLGVCIISAALIVSLPQRQPAPTAAEVGRYQFVRSNGTNCFVLDTKSGRLWQRFVPSSEGPTDGNENKVPWTEAPAGRLVAKRSPRCIFSSKAGDSRRTPSPALSSHRCGRSIHSTRQQAREATTLEK